MKNVAAENNDYHNAIVDAVCYWLGYQFKIGRDQLIHEASLRYPVADTITAKGVRIDRIVLEQLHPIFKSKKIDLVVFQENLSEFLPGNNLSKIKEVFEFKLAKSNTSLEFGDEHQRVFDDVVRLAYYNLLKDKDCYFLMCGEYEKFKAFFVGQQSAVMVENGRNNTPIKTQSKDSKQINPIKDMLSTEWIADGIYKDWFGFSSGEEKMIVFKTTDYENWGLKIFLENYKFRDSCNYEPDTVESIKLKIKCISVTSGGLENVRTHAAGIWKIQAIKE
jgi:hypothetical protein